MMTYAGVPVASEPSSLPIGGAHATVTRFCKRIRPFSRRQSVERD